VTRLGHPIAGLALLAAVFLGGCRSANADRARQLEAEIARWLPAGSDPTRVIAFLEGRGLEHSGYVSSTRTVYAKATPQQAEFLIQSAVLLECHFTEEIRLDRCDVREVFTGP
jgi:hypothetical protein